MSVKLQVTKTYKLQFPVTITRTSATGEASEETISEMEIRKPLAGDLRATDGEVGEAGKGLALIAHLTGQPQLVIDRLELPDFMALDALVQDFLPSGLLTGGQP